MIAEQSAPRFGAGPAKRYHDELFALFDLIAVNPRITHERDEIDPPVRVHPFKAHLIVYLIEDDETVFVIRIRHGQDWAGGSV